MKTAISLPDAVFQEAERLARQTKKSRSQLYSLALQEYVARHASDHVMETMDRVCDSLGASAKDDFTTVATRRILEQSEW